MPSVPTSTMTPRQWAGLVALAVLWGGSFFFISVAVKELPPLTFVMTRLVLAAIILSIAARLGGVALPRDGKTWGLLFALGLLNNALPFTLFAWAQTHITGGLASILNATQPLFTVVAAHLLTRDEKVTALRTLGTVIGFTGVAAMIGYDAFAESGGQAAAQLACVMASLSYAFAAVLGRRLTGLPPLVLATGQISAAALLMIPVASVIDQPWTMALPSAAAVTAVLCQAAFSTALAYLLFFRLLERIGAVNVGLVTFLNPVVAIVLGVTFMSEHLAPAHMAGMALIGVGLAFLDGRVFRRR